MTAPTTARCGRCKKVRAVSRFVADRTRRSGLFPWCKDCVTEHRGTRKFQDDEGELNGFHCPLCGTAIRGHKNRRFCSNTCKDRTKVLQKKYGVTPAQYHEMVDAVNNRCPICLRRPTVFHMDHNHRTRRVTGPVCAACNVGALASTYHDIEFVERLLAYLRNPTADQLGIEAIVPETENKPSNLHKVWRHAGARKRS